MKTHLTFLMITAIAWTAAAGPAQPSGMQCRSQPYYDLRPDGQPGREMTVDFTGGALHENADVEVRCNGITERSKIPAEPGGRKSFTALLPTGAGVVQPCQAEVIVHLAKGEFRQTVDDQGGKQDGSAYEG